MRKLAIAILVFGGMAALIWAEAVGQPADRSIAAADVAAVVEKTRETMASAGGARAFFECVARTDGRGAC